MIIAIAPINHVWPIAPGFIYVYDFSPSENLGGLFKLHSLGLTHFKCGTESYAYSGGLSGSFHKDASVGGKSGSSHWLPLSAHDLATSSNNYSKEIIFSSLWSSYISKLLGPFLTYYYSSYSY